MLVFDMSPVRIWGCEECGCVLSFVVLFWFLGFFSYYGRPSIDTRETLPNLYH